MKVTETGLAGVLIIEPDVHRDDRGFFVEIYHAARYAAEAGIDSVFVQDNRSRSRHHVLRGLHLQREHPQGKLVMVMRGEIWCVAADVNPASPTFRQHVGVPLSETNHQQIYVPPGYAHGFCVVSDVADVTYKCTDFRYANDEAGIAWNDPDLAITWPTETPKLSDRDKANPSLASYLQTYRDG